MIVNTTEIATTLYISGGQSGTGKSSVCLGLLASLLAQGFKPQELGYIKPVTQCTKTQLVAQFCQQNSIACEDMGPVVFYQGFTQEFIQGKIESAEELRQKIKTCILEFKQNKKFVLIDGVGYPAVGSIAGISNATIATMMNTPVLLIGKPGIGDAIDNLNLDLNYFKSNRAAVIGAIFNKLPEEHFKTYKKFVSQYFEKELSINLYGFVPSFFNEDENITEIEKITRIKNYFTQHIDIKQLLTDLQHAPHVPVPEKQ